jgi:hypothetical protein
MGSNKEHLPARSSQAEVDAFLRTVSRTPPRGAGDRRGRLLFAMDATASREPTWDRACDIQARMFEETVGLGGIEVQLAFYRGFRELRVSRWLSDAPALLRAMSAVRCVGGLTQIERVLDHLVAETRRTKVDAAVFIGDCIEEQVDRVCHRAGELGLLGVPVFVFQEGWEPTAERGFREVARLTGGAYCRFDASSAQHLRDLLGAVAVYAAGGRRALEDFGNRHGEMIKQLSHQVTRG